ncbi:nucleobindin-2-like isoform X2 [Mya arenaria]|uniref:nucleobindin-2-like isoform X2 n=1 Tax=Mya arenaria TaxID=6604 RepID=UPI0022E59C0D|nr:nucleobindin-2-like isoform X2 [Mya arenaria]
MRLLLFLLGCVMVQDIVCPPVQPEIKPVEGMSPDDEQEEEDPAFGLEYERYLREVVTALEEDEGFRKKLEEMNMTDIKNGKISQHLELVSHQIREKLDEIKRQEIQRLRQLAKEKIKMMNGVQAMDNSFLHHLDTKNAHSFEAEDLEKLIKKATGDLDEIDKKRRGEFKTYEMEKEHLRREELKKLDEDQRKQKEHEFEELQKKHKEHKPVHHPGSKAQLEDVWEKTDNMDTQDFNPKTFFNMHDLDGNGFLDGEEVEALFQKELDEVYDPNNPEDDMREKYEDMGRMREHVFNEIDTDKDHLISQEEFLNYTNSNQFEKDEGWKTVDEEQNYTEEELERYEQMLREHEERARAQGIDPNQPGMVPLGHDPNVQEMQMPHEGMPQQGMHQQGQQFNQGQQRQFQQHEQQQQMRQMGQMQGQMPQGQMGQGQMGQMHQGQMGQGQMGQMHQGQTGQMHQGQMGQGQMHGQMPQGQMGQGQMNQMPQGQMGQGQMPQGQMHQMGQMPGGGPMDGPPGRPPMQGGPPAGQMPMQGGQQAMGGQMPGRQDHVAMGQAQINTANAQGEGQGKPGGEQPQAQGQPNVQGQPAGNAQSQNINSDTQAKVPENTDNKQGEVFEKIDQTPGQGQVLDNSEHVQVQAVVNDQVHVQDKAVENIQPVEGQVHAKAETVENIKPVEGQGQNVVEGEVKGSEGQAPVEV